MPRSVKGKTVLLGAATLVTALMASTALQASDYGSFDGYTLRVKLIGGAQYEPLYAEIAQWEEMTGATVEILSRKTTSSSTVRSSRTLPLAHWIGASAPTTPALPAIWQYLCRSARPYL